ncbi:MAG TPA: class I SAM-dependent methyltransferase [Rhizomicrobium sp.]|nr:class I SAM-dependent methyltransferase [Rhizomicrobium sp.]
MENCYEDATRAAAYAGLGFTNTYHLAFRDVPALLREVPGRRAMDFGCGAGRSTRFLNGLGFAAVGVDIAPQMIARAREADPAGDYRLVKGELLEDFADESFDAVLCAFPFDNIPDRDAKVRLFRSLRRVTAARGRIINIVSSPEIYTHEWSSFTTRDFPENRDARPGDVVRIVTTDFGDRRPCEDILWPDACYREVYAEAQLSVAAMHKPLATGEEGYAWVSETVIAPWVIYVLSR